MKATTWEQRVLAWKQRATTQDIVETQEELRQEAFEKGETLGKLKGMIKGEISKVKSLIKFGVPQEKIITDLKFLTNEKVRDKLESNIAYIQEHTNDSDSEICEELGLVGDLADFGT